MGQKKDKKSTIDNTFAALQREMAGTADRQYEFDAHYKTKKDEYDVFVQCELFGAFIHEDGYIEVHTRVLKARGLPKAQDEELIDKVHQTILDVIHGGSPKMNPDDMKIVPLINHDAIDYRDTDDLDRLEIEIIEMCKNKDLTIEETGELFDRMLNRVVTMLTVQNEIEAMTIDGFLEGHISRQITRSQYQEINYIQ